MSMTQVSDTAVVFLPWSAIEREAQLVEVKYVLKQFVNIKGD